MKLALSVLLIGLLAGAAVAEQVLSINTKTDTCFNCGMNNGELGIKVCGNVGCCFAWRLDNSDNNFQSGDYDEFNGGGVIPECDQFEVYFQLIVPD